ncbi:MAG: glycosyl transferase group 1 [Rhodocyclaceae bacterium]|nr:glycosyl transferase group 1 [Rhodocyclaceae bacterium]
MRIAIISPLMESVPPKLYGGTERIVSYLTEELVHQGHDVTLFASGDSVTCADLRPITEQGLRLDPACRDPFAHYAIMLDQVASVADEFDVLHFNIDYLHFPLARQRGLRTVTTLHGRLDLPDLLPLYRHFDDIPLVSISDAQRQPLPVANWAATIYHGLPSKLYSLHRKPGDYLAFLGRISPEKRPDRAIRIARRAGIPLKIAAKVEKGVDEVYFEECIRPLLAGPGVEFIGEIGEGEKNEFLGNALALLFPIDWPEPFGLVMIEAMACGTPVVAFPCGSVPEVIREGVNGYIAADEDEAVAAVEKCAGLDRQKCRADFEEHFSAERMTRDYVRVYGRLLADSPSAIEA